MKSFGAIVVFASDFAPTAVQAQPCQPSLFHDFHQPAGSFPLLVVVLDALDPPTLADEVPPTLAAEVPPTELDVPPLELPEVLLLVPPAAVVDEEELVPPLEVLDEDEDVAALVPPLEVLFDEELDVPPLPLPPWLAAVVLLLVLPPWFDAVVEFELEFPPWPEALLLPPALGVVPAEQTPALHSGVFPLQTTPHWPQL